MPQPNNQTLFVILCKPFATFSVKYLKFVCKFLPFGLDTFQTTTVKHFLAYLNQNMF